MIQAMSSRQALGRLVSVLLLSCACAPERGGDEPPSPSRKVAMVVPVTDFGLQPAEATRLQPRWRKRSSGASARLLLQMRSKSDTLVLFSVGTGFGRVDAGLEGQALREKPAYTWARELLEDTPPGAPASKKACDRVERHGRRVRQPMAGLVDAGPRNPAESHLQATGLQPQ
jgi:hypothetical protein